MKKKEEIKENALKTVNKYNVENISDILLDIFDNID